MNLRAVLFGLVVAVTASCFGQSGLQATVDSSSSLTSGPDLKNVRIDQLLGAQVPLNTPFKDWNGSPVNFGTLLGQRPAILVPIFYNCTGVCQLELANLCDAIPEMKSMKLGKDYDIVILSINPTETPSLAATKRTTLMNTIKLNGTEGGWHLLTGTLPNIRSVTDAVGFRYTYDVDKNFVNHPSGIMILAPTGRVSSYIYGANYTPAVLTRDLQVASRDEVGAKTTEIFFGCIHCDPVTGQKTIVFQNVLRLFGVVTIICILCTLVSLSGRKLFRRQI
jgi:protein SCO1/2